MHSPPFAFRRVFAVSDLHTDYAANLRWATGFGDHRADALIVAGDVSSRLSTFAATLAALTTSFGAVFFVPGNHDLWVRRDGTEGADSLEKLRRLHEVCDALGVLTTPQRLTMAAGAPLCVLPLLSWYHTSFDTEPAVKALRLPSARAVVSDFRACKWPAPHANGAESLAVLFDALCDTLPGERAAAQAEGRAGLTPLASYADARGGGGGDDDPVLSFSHFVPRIELIPEKRFLTFPPLMEAVGSVPLGRRLDMLRPDLHVFGHTHFGWDSRVDGVRYVQAALATPAERRRRPRSLAIGRPPTRAHEGGAFAKDGGHRAPSAGTGLELASTQSLPAALPLLLYDGERAEFAPRYHAEWSAHYDEAPRRAADTSPAAWVVEHWRRIAPHRLS